MEQKKKAQTELNKFSDNTSNKEELKKERPPQINMSKLGGVVYFNVPVAGKYSTSANRLLNVLLEWKECGKLVQKFRGYTYIDSNEENNKRIKAYKDKKMLTKLDEMEKKYFTPPKK